MRKANKAVIAAAEAYYFDSNETDRHNDLMDAVCALLADRAAREVEKKEPPIGSRVRDCQGDVWERYEAGWRFKCMFHSWKNVRYYKPLTLLPPEASADE